MKKYLKYMLEMTIFFTKNSKHIESGLRYYYYYPIAFCKFMKYSHNYYLECVKRGWLK